MSGRLRTVISALSSWEPLTGVDPHSQSKWERGKARAASQSKTHPAFSYLYTVFPAVATAAVVQAEPWERVIAAFIAGTLAWLLVPYAWAAVVALRAAPRQRDEARTALRETKDALEQAELDQRNAMNQADKERKAAVEKILKQHEAQMNDARMKIMRLELQEHVKQGDGISGRIQEFREAEQIKNGRTRSQVMREKDPTHHFLDKTQQIASILTQGGRSDLVDSLVGNREVPKTADQFDAAYKQLIQTASAVIAEQL